MKHKSAEMKAEERACIVMLNCAQSQKQTKENKTFFFFKQEDETVIGLTRGDEVIGIRCGRHSESDNLQQKIVTEIHSVK